MMQSDDLLVRMLPGIDTQQGNVLPHDRVLVRVGPDADLARLLVLDEPRPPAALDAGQGGVELLLELVVAAVDVVDSLGQRARGGVTAAGALGRQVLPEEGVVDVPAAVEVDGGFQGDLGRHVVLGLRLVQLLERGVVVGHVGVVVVLVVQLHDLARDGGLEGAVVVCVRC